MKKIIILAIAILAIGGTVALIKRNSSPKVYTYGDTPATASNNVSTQGDKQIIEIKAKGGYSPTMTIAKSGIPTILRVKTDGTFDCSSTLRIPGLSFSKNLLATDTTDIAISAQEPGAKIEGLCSMGMYHFSINFQS